eukprot:1289999-Pleurochrysis_carterae.AAC.1
MAAGGAPAPVSSRAHVHAQLTVLALAELGLHAAPAKVLVGDAVTALGFQVSARDRSIRCPDGKRELLLATVEEMMRRETATRGRVSWRGARTLAGRLCNLGQAFPELRSALRGAYAVAQPLRGRGGGGWRSTDEWLSLAKGGAAEAERLACLDVARDVLEHNEGIPAAPRLDFPAPEEDGVLLATTDASGVDGVGGFAFDAGAPLRPWVVSQQWPADVAEALR